MATPELQQFRGSLIGQCLGDALGFVVEGYPPEICRGYVDGVLRAGTAGSHGRGAFQFGQYTDDSQLARELLQSVVARSGFEPADYAARVAAIFVEERIVGRGRATEEAARRLAAGVPWDQAGTPAPSAGNGSAMRAGPVGLLYGERPDELVRVACDQGRITHQDPRCSAGAVAIAAAVAVALERGAIDPTAFCARVAHAASLVEPSVARAIVRLPDWVRLQPEQAAGEIAPVGRAGVSDGWQGISPFVTPSVLWSLYSFLRSPDDYWETLCTAIAVGGDVDTTAAMAGAISGARVGLDALPAPLTARLNDRGTWTLPELCALADAASRLRAPAA